MNDVDIELTERYKDEIWNLELSKQELLQKIHDLSQSLSRSTAEQNRLAKQEEKLCQEIEQFKTVQHTWESSLTAAQEQHEEETLALKKMLYSLRIEKDQVAKQLQEVLAIQQQQNGLRHIDTSLSSSEGPASSTPTVAVASSSPDNNTRVVHSKSVVATRHEAEITALKTSLDQAHGIIQTMQAKIDEERQERTERGTRDNRAIQPALLALYIATLFSNSDGFIATSFSCLDIQQTTAYIVEIDWKIQPWQKAIDSDRLISLPSTRQITWR